MPWYYAGPDATPVGPIPLEQLQARRAAGTIMADTYVLEATGLETAPLAWKRYSEAFPPAGSAPVPPLPTMPPPIVPPVPPIVPAIPANPLFPSAAPAYPGYPQHPPLPVAAHPSLPPGYRPTNTWCAWGFGLGLAGLCFSLACGVGIIMALPALVLCAIGLAQVWNNRAQSGRGLAIAGIGCSLLALLIALGFLVWFVYPLAKASGLTVTEQSSSDSE